MIRIAVSGGTSNYNTSSVVFVPCFVNYVAKSQELSLVEPRRVLGAFIYLNIMALSGSPLMCCMCHVSDEELALASHQQGVYWETESYLEDGRILRNLPYRTEEKFLNGYVIS